MVALSREALKIAGLDIVTLSPLRQVLGKALPEKLVDFISDGQTQIDELQAEHSPCMEWKRTFNVRYSSHPLRKSRNKGNNRCPGEAKHLPECHGKIVRSTAERVCIVEPIAAELVHD